MVTKILENDINEIINDNSVDRSLFNNSCVLITGSTGMIGQYITFMMLFLQKKYNITIKLLVRNRQKTEVIFGDYLNDNVEIIVSDLKSIPEIEGEVTYILHAASLTSPNYYETIPVDVIEPNVLGTYNLLKIALEKQTKNFLFFSSSEIYGKVDSSINYGEEELGRLDCAEVRNCYAESKRMGDNLCCSFSKQYGLHTNSVRIFHTYGPTMDILTDPRAFSEFVYDIVNNKDIVIKSEGFAKRPFCYITDAVVAFMPVLFNGESGEAYNMSNEDNYVSINDLANTLVKLNISNGTKIIYREREKTDTYSIKRDENYVSASSQKLKNLG